MTSSRLSITVAAPLVITTTSLPGATTGAAYEVTLAASGGVAPYTWLVTSGPAWRAEPRLVHRAHLRHAHRLGHLRFHGGRDRLG